MLSTSRGHDITLVSLKGPGDNALLEQLYFQCNFRIFTMRYLTLLKYSGDSYCLLDAEYRKHNYRVILLLAFVTGRIDPADERSKLSNGRSSADFVGRCLAHLLA